MTTPPFPSSSLFSPSLSSLVCAVPNGHGETCLHAYINMNDVNLMQWKLYKWCFKQNLTKNLILILLMTTKRRSSRCLSLWSKTTLKKKDCLCCIYLSRIGIPFDFHLFFLYIIYSRGLLFYWLMLSILIERLSQGDRFSRDSCTRSQDVCECVSNSVAEVMIMEIKDMYHPASCFLLPLMRWAVTDARQCATCYI